MKTIILSHIHMHMNLALEGFFTALFLKIFPASMSLWELTLVMWGAGLHQPPTLPSLGKTRRNLSGLSWRYIRCRKHGRLRCGHHYWKHRQSTIFSRKGSGEKEEQKITTLDLEIRTQISVTKRGPLRGHEKQPALSNFQVQSSELRHQELGEGR